MKRLLVAAALLMVPLGACTRPDLPTLLRDAKYGVEAVCAIGQETLSDATCADFQSGLDAAIAIATKDGAAAVAPVKAILTDLQTRHPEGTDWLSWITSRL